MNDDEIIALVAAARPEPPPALRSRILAAAASITTAPPWWAQVRTWTVAAVLLAMVNWRVMSPQPPMASAPIRTEAARILEPAAESTLGPLHLAILRRSPPATHPRTFALISRFSQADPLPDTVQP